MKRFLILAYHDGVHISPAVRSCVNAVKRCGAIPDLFLLEEQGGPEALQNEARSIEHVACVVVIKSAFACSRVPELAADMFAYAVKSGNYDGAVASSDSYGKDVLPRLAAVFPSSPVTDISDVAGSDNLFHRFIHAGGIVEKIKARGKPLLLTFRAASFPRAEDRRNADIAPVEYLSYSPPCDMRTSEFLGTEQSCRSGRPDPSFARVVVSGGRGARGAEGFGLLEKLADEISGCAVGASRAAVDAGFASGDMQIGQTGKIVSPELYLAAGISGAAQHWAGMKDSRVIACVNIDGAAPMCESADYVLNDDLFKVLPELTRMIRHRNLSSSRGRSSSS